MARRPATLVDAPIVSSRAALLKAQTLSTSIPPRPCLLRRHSVPLAPRGDATASSPSIQDTHKPSPWGEERLRSKPSRMTEIVLCKPSTFFPTHVPSRDSTLTLRAFRAFSTFLKRKGGLFKKAHELSVLCSVDVAVFIFGNNKKLYEYSSSDMRDLITRYQYVSLARVNPHLPRPLRPSLRPRPDENLIY